jgi:DNA-binding response OmpR family regulator
MKSAPAESESRQVPGEAERVLVVEDDDEIASAIAAYLRREGYVIGRAADGPSALTQARTGKWHLILLDVMLPGLNGIEVCRRLRAENVDQPIVFLTARGDETDQVLGLGLGGDAYIVKPFLPAALVANVNAQLRRYRMQQTAASSEKPLLRFSGLEIDVAGCEVTRSGQRVQLTATEFELLRFLATHPGRVFTREQLIRQVWHDEWAGDTNTVVVHLRRLREKIEQDPSNPRYVVTVRGLGYRFTADG